VCGCFGGGVFVGGKGSCLVRVGVLCEEMRVSIVFLVCIGRATYVVHSRRARTSIDPIVHPKNVHTPNRHTVGHDSLAKFFAPNACVNKPNRIDPTTRRSGSCAWRRSPTCPTSPGNKHISRERKREREREREKR
jgi:hypothetical protein